MQFKAKTTKWNKIEADALVFFVSEENWKKEISHLDAVSKNKLSQNAQEDNFRAKPGEIYSYRSDLLHIKTFLLVGVGKSKKVSSQVMRIAGSYLIKYVKSGKKTSLAIDLTGETINKINSSDLVKAIVEGILLGGYKFHKYKNTAEKADNLKEVFLLALPANITLVTGAIIQAQLFAEATNYSRDLVNEPPSYTTPAYLANEAKKLANNDSIRVQILEKKEIEKLGMQAFLAVAKGSQEPLKFIKLIYKGSKNKENKKVVIAGKAITFDTGGLSLKDSKGMETMKLDMAGAATVLGVFKALPQLKPKVDVVGLIAACENMPGPNATKPGDIVKALNGKTIEILNTDAEGRLTLADVLSYAVTLQPNIIIDLATLTGACMVALGEEIAGLFSNNEDLVKDLLNSADGEGEKLWQLPLEEDYKDSIKSDIADLRNISKTRYGGAITASLFLEEFVDTTPWAHLDIAGPAFEEKETPVVPKGGAGFGVRTLLSWLKAF